MKWDEFKHNHYTRDIRPQDCPKCRVQQLEANVKELEKVAQSWMDDYQALKDKYEPEGVVAESVAEPAECYGLEETFRRAESDVGWIEEGGEPPRSVKSISLKEFTKERERKSSRSEPDKGVVETMLDIVFGDDNW